MQQSYDLVVIGSGFGGVFFALPWVSAGKRVLMLERADWVTRGDECWADNGSLDLTPYYSTETPYRVIDGNKPRHIGSCACVGGPSVFYGGVSLRFRPKDFTPEAGIVGDSHAAWPLHYDDLESYYSEAEQLLGVAGRPGADPTDPPRKNGYPQEPMALTPAAQRIQAGAERCGLKPFNLPLAINYCERDQRSACIACRTCDTFACAISAKNDLASTLIPDLVKRGMTIRHNAMATRLLTENNRITGVEIFDTKERGHQTINADRVVVSAGALGTPHLILASQLEQKNPGGALVGRHLMRHCNGIVFGIFPMRPDPKREFHKQLGIHDYYFGHPDITNPTGKIGSLQQLQTPPIGLARAHLPPVIRNLAGPFVERMTGLLSIAEDQPRYENHVRANWDKKNESGLPELEIEHFYTERDLAARKALNTLARKVMRRAGAWFTYTRTIETFSHALGTMRMGTMPEQSVLDADCHFRGIDNLYISDASVFPTAAAVNPSLTVAANGLRVGRRALEALHGNTTP